MDVFRLPWCAYLLAPQHSLGMLCQQMLCLMMAQSAYL